MADYNLTVKERIRLFAGTTHLENKYFEARVGVANGTLSKPNNPTTPMLEKIKASFPRLDMNWVITGRGDMLLPDNPRKNDAESPEVAVQDVAESHSDYVRKSSDFVQVHSSLLISMNDQLRRKDEQIAFLQAELHELLKKL